jgi:hypothetical protein
VLRQANVTGPGAGVTIGSCGAQVVSGPAAGGGRDLTASSRAVSNDGSHVFFEAVPPGQGCSEPKHLYARVNGGTEHAETLDIGPYKFIAADAHGSQVLLEKPNGENPGLYLYRTGSPPELLPSSGVLLGRVLVVSEDLSTVYTHDINKGGALYRYDVPARKLLFVTQMSVDSELNFYAASPDGRYFYFIAASVAGLPGGGQALETPGAARVGGQTSQVYRYDSAEALVQCMSCASSFDHYEPRLSALFTDKAEHSAITIASANGDYVFFDTPAALLPGDIEEQRAAEGSDSAEHISSNYSVSSDVYEWRRDGVDGCSLLQGCLALITSGHGGFLNTLLGTTSTGRDVFFSTNESLLPSDNDTAGDIYDARVGGGFPEPAHPVECEGDACSTPLALPLAQASATLTALSSGNVAGEIGSRTVSKAGHKPKAKPRCKARRKRRCKAKPRKKAPKRARRALRHAATNGGVGR